MSIKDIRHELERAADRNIIPEHRVIPLTLLTVLEAGQQAFHKAYYGEILTKEIANVRAMEHTARELALTKVEHTIQDLTRVRKMHQETLTTSDFPLALAQARDVAQRDAYTLPESDLIQFVSRRPAQNFKPLNATRPGVLSHRFAPIRPEATNIEYANFFQTDEGYTVSDVALGLNFTWEMYVNDDMSAFTQAAAALGVTFRQTRAFTILDVILRKAERIPLVDGDLGPTSSNLDAIAEWMSRRVDPVTGRRVARKPSDLFVGTKWERLARRSMEGEYLVPTGGAAGALAMRDPRNPVYQMSKVHVEDMIADALEEFPDRYASRGLSPDDYIVMANGAQKPIELATLKGYEGGPKTFTRMVNVDETDLEGDFENRGFALKVHDVIGADLRDPYALAIAAGD